MELPVEVRGHTLPTGDRYTLKKKLQSQLLNVIADVYGVAPLQVVTECTVFVDFYLSGAGIENRRTSCILSLSHTTQLPPVPEVQC